MGCINSTRGADEGKISTLSPMGNSSHLTPEELDYAVKSKSKSKSFAEDHQHVNVKLADLQYPTKSGFLMKRSKFKHKWTRRFVIMQASSLYSCHDEHSDPNNVLQLEVSTQLTFASEGAAGKSEHQSMLREQPNAFLVQDAHGQFWPLACEDREDMDNWIGLIQAEIDDARLLSLYKATLMRTVQTGANFIKYNKSFSSQDKTRHVSVSTDCRHIIWHKEGSGEFSELAVADILEVVAGAATDVLKKAKVDDQRAFAVKAKSRTLDLVASSKDERDTWVKALSAVVKFGAVLTPEELGALEEDKRVKLANMHAQEAVEGRKKGRSKLKNMLKEQSA